MHGGWRNELKIRKCLINLHFTHSTILSINVSIIRLQFSRDEERKTNPTKVNYSMKFARIYPRETHETKFKGT